MAFNADHESDFETASNSPSTIARNATSTTDRSLQRHESNVSTGSSAFESSNSETDDAALLRNLTPEFQPAKSIRRLIPHLTPIQELHTSPQLQQQLQQLQDTAIRIEKSPNKQQQQHQLHKHANETDDESTDVRIINSASMRRSGGGGGGGTTTTTIASSLHALSASIVSVRVMVQSISRSMWLTHRRGMTRSIVAFALCLCFATAWFAIRQQQARHAYNNDSTTIAIGGRGVGVQQNELNSETDFGSLLQSSIMSRFRGASSSDSVNADDAIDNSRVSELDSELQWLPRHKHRVPSDHSITTTNNNQLVTQQSKQRQPSSATLNALRLAQPGSVLLTPWQEWLTRRDAAAHSYVDYTWLHTGAHKQYDAVLAEIDARDQLNLTLLALDIDEKPSASEPERVVVNDAMWYVESHAREGALVSLTRNRPLAEPHPRPLSPDLGAACNEMHLQSWLACNDNAVPQPLQGERMPGTRFYLTVMLLDAYIDSRGTCHGEVPGALFSRRATFHFQRWMGADCHNAPVPMPESNKVTHVPQLISGLGVYGSELGHFAPMHLGRLLRTLAVAPTTAKVLLPTGQNIQAYLDCMIEIGALTRDRVVWRDDTTYHAHAVWKTDTYPYLDASDRPGRYLYSYDEIDLKLVHEAFRPIAMSQQPTPLPRRLVYVQRGKGSSRSIANEDQVLELLRKLASELQLELAIFTGAGHVREHMRLFATAQMTFAPHGAGLANVLWMTEGSSVMECGYTSDHATPDMYFLMSVHLKLRYHLVKADGSYSSPLTVNLDQVAWHLAEFAKHYKQTGPLTQALSFNAASQ